jgi:hypothetical protein
LGCSGFKNSKFGNPEMPRAVTMRSLIISSTLVLAVGNAASAADLNVNNSVIRNSFNNVGNQTITSGGISFDMVVSQAARNCLPNAQAQIQIGSAGTVEDMFISASGLPPNTDFDFFVSQVPNAPFGLSWYQGDLETDSNGNAMQHFRGRFNVETFIVAPGIAAAPLVFNNPPFADAAQNPASGPVQIYHLGLWFNSPADAAKAGCPNTVTPFNGEHNAGIQVLNTSNYPDNSGPLRNLNP